MNFRQGLRNLAAARRAGSAQRQSRASWFETREDALLTMRVRLRAVYEDLVLRSIATGSRECAPADDRKSARVKMTGSAMRLEGRSG